MAVDKPSVSSVGDRRMRRGRRCCWAERRWVGREGPAGGCMQVVADSVAGSSAGEGMARYVVDTAAAGSRGLDSERKRTAAAAAAVGDRGFVLRLRGETNTRVKAMGCSILAPTLCLVVHAARAYVMLG